MIVLATAESLSLGALVSAIISAFVSVCVNAYMNRGHNERMVYGQVQKMIEFGMAYPYLEDDDFCAAWPEIQDDEDNVKRQRYEYYCCHLFNTLERVYELCSHDTSCMSRYLYPDEVVLRHKKWWRQDQHNIAGYSEEFREFIDHILARHGAGQ